MAKRKKSKKKISFATVERSSEESSERTVDDFLIALQKTLSRVSRESAKVPSEQARSLITGNVAFDVDLKCSLGAGQKLMLNDETGAPLRLSGQLSSDIGIEFLEDADAEAPPEETS